jgi:hypothetical protein
MSYLTELDRIKDELAGRFPGWQIWYSPRMDRTALWCGRPYPQLAEASPEDLAEAIERAEAGR